jgi:hypothetical protein
MFSIECLFSCFLYNTLVDVYFNCFVRNFLALMLRTLNPVAGNNFFGDNFDPLWGTFESFSWYYLLNFFLKIFLIVCFNSFQHVYHELLKIFFIGTK